MAYSKRLLLGLLVLQGVMVCLSEADMSMSFKSLQERLERRTEAIQQSMNRLYLERLKGLERQAAKNGDYEAAKVYHEEAAHCAQTLGDEAWQPLTVTFYPEEADLSEGLRLEMKDVPCLAGWTTESKASWKRLTLPQGGYAVTIVYSGNQSPVMATLSEAHYHVSRELPLASSGLARASLGNLRLAEDTSTLTLSLTLSSPAPDLVIHDIILVSHAP